MPDRHAFSETRDETGMEGLQRENDALAVQVRLLQQRLADHAMIYEVFAGLTADMAESDAVDCFIGLVTALFAAERVEYVPVRDGHGGALDMSRAPWSAGSMAHDFDPTRDECAWIDDESGFLLRIGAPPRVTGVLMVAGFAFPEHRRHYLDLALSLSPVWSLAVHNARSYQRLSEMHVSRRMEAIGRLAAGVAHEINTPLQFVALNLTFLKEACSQLEQLITPQVDVGGGDGSVPPSVVSSRPEDSDVEFWRQEIPVALDQALAGISRIATIVKALVQSAGAERGADECPQ